MKLRVTDTSKVSVLVRDAEGVVDDVIGVEGDDVAVCDDAAVGERRDMDIVLVRDATIVADGECDRVGRRRRVTVGVKDLVGR